MQVVIALIVTPEGFPLTYEVMPGNTAERTTPAAFLEKIERQYGRSERIWITDRGIPTEETLASMREGDAPVRCLVGTPKGRLTRLEKAFLDRPWQEVRQSVDVKLLVEDGELYVLVRSERRLLKERGMRRRRLNKLWRRLGELQRQSNSRDQLMLKLGAAKKEAGHIETPAEEAHRRRRRASPAATAAEVVAPRVLSQLGRQTARLARVGRAVQIAAAVRASGLAAAIGLQLVNLLQERPGAGVEKGGVNEQPVRRWAPSLEISPSPRQAPRRPSCRVAGGHPAPHIKLLEQNPADSHQIARARSPTNKRNSRL